MSVTVDNVKEYYAQDLVYKFDNKKRIKFGVVSESYEGSDLDEGSTLQKGQILVSWNNSTRKQVCRQSKVHLMSRSIIPGDIVRRLEDGTETQRGYCKKTAQCATIQIVESDKVIEHVPESRLDFVKPFDLGDAVALGDKYGRVQGIDHVLRMQSICGSIVEVRTSINFNIRDFWNYSINGAYESPAYPGQTLICTPLHLKDPIWIKKSKAMKRKMELGQMFTIQSIEICLVEVWWHLPNGTTEYGEVKDDEIKRLRILPYSEHLVIGDRHLLKLKPTDILIKKSEWLKKKSLQHLPKKVPTSDNLTFENTPSEQIDIDDDWQTEEDSDQESKRSSLHLAKIQLRKKRGMRRMNKYGASSVVAVQVLCTNSKATIVWQDGTEETNIPTTDLYYSISLDDHEFFPGEWVMSNSNDNAEKYGVVQKVNFLERTAEIKWFAHNEGDAKSTELLTNEVSVYDLKKHAKYVFRPGSVVKANPTIPNKMGKVIDSCPEGYVIVNWLRGPNENCWPHNIELIPESEEFDFPDDFDDSDDDISEDAYSWETESIESFDGAITDEMTLQNMAAKVDFIRNRLSYLREAFKQHSITKNFQFIKDLLMVYDNSRYLDKYLGTAFFSLDSKHFQALLLEARKKAKALGIELRGRIFSKENLNSTFKLKNAEKESVQKVIDLENNINAQIENNKECHGELCPPVPDASPQLEKADESLCVELLFMLKIRLDLVYAEIISRIGDRQALTVLTNSSEGSMTPSPSTILQNTLLTPEEISSPPKLSKPNEIVSKDESFSIIEEAPQTHHYYGTECESKDVQKFLNVLQKEYKLLKESLPAGVWVRTFGDRTDLLSVMIRGPSKTPYEDGLFLFDIQLGMDYPKNPPAVFFISFIKEQLNPNLYVEGKVCVSLLGTWMGRGSEVWGPNSTLLQLIVSIQGLILVSEPYYNEAGYERQSQTQQGCENARTYNEFVLLKLVQAMTELIHAPPPIFQSEILAHFKTNGTLMHERLTRFLKDEAFKPEFALLPISKGLKLSLTNALLNFSEMLLKVFDSDNNKV